MARRSHGAQATTLQRKLLGNSSNTSSRQRRADRQVATRSQLIEAAPAAALLDASAAADLIVVGSRGRGALRSVFGSVARAITEAATCPVVVVQPQHEQRRDRAQVTGTDRA
jgi:nucleotide-binding universal stress UspA family protein